jgi:sec-independent protein translocase protein TatA
VSLLFLNSIGGGEFIIIILIVLMVFGADSIPNIARTLGKGIRQVKDATQEIQRDIVQSANSQNNPIKELKESAEDVRKTLDQNLDI